MRSDPRNEWAVSPVEEEDFRLDLSDEQLDEIVAQRPVTEPVAGARRDRAVVSQEVAPSDELRDVTRRISSQFLDVLHVTVSALFAGREARAAAAQLVAALDSLRRLSVAGHDDAQRELLDEILAQATAFVQDPKGRARDRFLARLRPWLLRYAEQLGGDDGARLRALVEFDARELPLFSELAAIPGIGPRRLERLFCAGLHAVEVVGASDPAEVAAVTGLPRALAVDVVTRARDFQEQSRRRTVLEMRARTAEFHRIVAGIDRERNSELWAAATAAAQEMQAVLARLQEAGG